MSGAMTREVWQTTLKNARHTEDRDKRMLVMMLDEIVAVYDDPHIDRILDKYASHILEQR